MSKERWSPRHTECCCYFPWATCISVAVAASGLVVWVIFARRAFDYTQQTIDALRIVKPAELQWVSIGMLAAAIAFGVCLGLSLLLAMWRGRISSHVDDEGEASPSSGGYLTSNFLLNCINWLVVLFIVLLLAAFTVWGAFSFALDKGAAASFTFAGQAQSTIKEGVALAEQFLTFYDSFSGNLKATLQSNPAGAQLAQQFSTLDNEVGKLRGAITNGVCPAYCLDLSAFSFLSGNRCICDPSILNKAANSSNQAWRALVPAVIGMLLMYVGGSWVSHNLVAHYARTACEQDLSERMPYTEHRDTPHVAMAVEEVQYDHSQYEHQQQYNQGAAYAAPQAYRSNQNMSDVALESGRSSHRQQRHDPYKQQQQLYYTN